MIIERQYISRNLQKKRPQIKMEALYLTIHSTGNPESTAQNEHDWLQNSENQNKSSFHVVVDDKKAIWCIPPNEVAWHAGDGRGPGNMKSIGLEICESGDREQTLKNAAHISAIIMDANKIPFANLKQHYDWSGKNCPRILRDTKRWEEFKKMIKEEMMLIDVSDWAKEACSWAIKEGITDGQGPKGTVTREMIWTMLYRLYQLMKGEK